MITTRDHKILLPKLKNYVTSNVKCRKLPMSHRMHIFPTRFKRTHRVTRGIIIPCGNICHRIQDKMANDVTSTSEIISNCDRKQTSLIFSYSRWSSSSWWWWRWWVRIRKRKQSKRSISTNEKSYAINVWKWWLFREFRLEFIFCFRFTLSPFICSCHLMIGSDEKC